MVSTMKMVDTKKATSRARPVVGIRVSRTGRRTYTLQYKLDVVRHCSELGVSVAAISMARRINAILVRRWIVRHRRDLTAAVVEPRATLLPVIVTAATAKPCAPADDLVDASVPRRELTTATRTTQVRQPQVAPSSGLSRGTRTPPLLLGPVCGVGFHCSTIGARALISFSTSPAAVIRSETIRSSTLSSPSYSARLRRSWHLANTRPAPHLRS